MFARGVAVFIWAMICVPSALSAGIPSQIFEEAKSILAADCGDACLKATSISIARRKVRASWKRAHILVVGAARLGHVSRANRPCQ